MPKTLPRVNSEMFDHGPSGNCQSSNCEGEQSFILRPLFPEACLRAFLTKSLRLGFSHYKGVQSMYVYKSYLQSVWVVFLGGNSG